MLSTTDSILCHLLLIALMSSTTDSKSLSYIYIANYVIYADSKNMLFMNYDATKFCLLIAIM